MMKPKKFWRRKSGKGRHECKHGVVYVKSRTGNYGAAVYLFVEHESGKFFGPFPDWLYAKQWVERRYGFDSEEELTAEIPGKPVSRKSDNRTPYGC